MLLFGLSPPNTPFFEKKKFSKYYLNIKIKKPLRLPPQLAARTHAEGEFLSYKNIVD